MMKDEIVYSEEPAGGTSLTLLERVQRQDPLAWVRLVSLYSPLIYHWSLRYGLQPADAEEVVQEVFLAVHRSIGSFRRDREGDTFRGWLRAITRSKVCDRSAPPGGTGAGGSDAQVHLAQLPAIEAVEPSSLDEDLGIVYRQALALIETEFEPTTRRAFWLLLGDRRPTDVADELGISVGAVYIAKSRILKRLREEFRELLEPWLPATVDGGAS